MIDPLPFVRDEFSRIVFEALGSKDFEAIEGLRDGPVANYLPELVVLYEQLDDWVTKDLLVHLIQDLDDPSMRPVMLNALSSPTVETRAIALCALQSNYALFGSFIVNGFVDAGRVDTAIAQYRDRAD